MLCAIEATLRIIAIKGIAAQTQIGVAVMTLKAIAMQHQTLDGGLLHKIHSLLAKAALLGGGLLLKGQCHLRALWMWVKAIINMLLLGLWLALPTNS